MTETNKEAEIEIIRKARNGDSEAFASLVEPLEQQLFVYLYRMVTHRETAEDLRQEVLLRAFEKLSNFRGEANFKTWLFGIATNACLDFLRYRKRWRVDAQLKGEEETDADPERLG